MTKDETLLVFTLITFLVSIFLFSSYDFLGFYFLIQDLAFHVSHLCNS